jgi:rhamnosyltransferase subunit B
MKILICAVGSHGDVLPFIGMGREFQQRGHTPHVFANGAYEHLAREAGLDFTPTGSANELATLLKNPDSTDPRKSIGVLAAAVMQGIIQSYSRLLQAFEPGNTIVVGSSLAWATRLLSETHKAPGAVIHLAPSWFRSEYVAPSFGPLGHLAGAPRFVKRWLFGALDKRFLDPHFTVPFNRIRADLGLAPIERAYNAWIHHADLTLGMFPEWFAPRQPDWPTTLTLTGFPLYDHGNNALLPDEVNAFLEAGEAPVLFTTGTANNASHAFFETSIQASQLSGHRAMFVTQDREQLPTTLPQGMAHFGYVPFQALLPRVAAFVHHGGIGSTSQALLAGVPQLIRPMGFDQFDNALRVMHMGVAQQLLPRRYRPKSAAQALSQLTSDSGVQKRCRQVAVQMATSQGVQATCDAILTLRSGARRDR